MFNKPILRLTQESIDFQNDQFGNKIESIIREIDDLDKSSEGKMSRDSRRIYYRQRIEYLQVNICKVVALIQHYGSILTTQFRDACVEFRYHADGWEDFWEAVKTILLSYRRRS